MVPFLRLYVAPWRPFGLQSQRPEAVPPFASHIYATDINCWKTVLVFDTDLQTAKWLIC